MKLDRTLEVGTRRMDVNPTWGEIMGVAQQHMLHISKAYPKCGGGTETPNQKERVPRNRESAQVREKGRPQEKDGKRESPGEREIETDPKSQNKGESPRERESDRESSREKEFPANLP